MSVQVLCPQCQCLSVLKRFRVEEGQLYLACSRCGVETATAARLSTEVPHDTAVPSHTSQLSLTSSLDASNVVTLRTAVNAAIEAADGANPFAVPEGHCPKCLAPREAQATCQKCGLQGASFQPAEAPGWLRDAWLTLLRDWGNEDAHRALCLRALHEGALVALGRLYQLRLIAWPNESIAKRGRAEVLKLATTQALTPQRGKTQRSTSAIQSISVAIIVLGALCISALLVRYILQLL